MRTESSFTETKVLIESLEEQILTFDALRESEFE